MEPELNLLEKSNLSPDTIKNTVLKHYNLQNAKVDIVKFKDTAKQRAVYKVEDNNKCYCLKKVYYDLPDLLYVYSANEWVYRYGIQVPKFIPTVNNNRFVYYSDMLFILTPWIDGVKCNFDDLNHVILSIKKLANMHLVSTDFQPILGSSYKVGLDDYYISTLKHFEQLLTISNQAFKYKDDFSKEFISNFDVNLYLAKLSLDIAYNIDNEDLSTSLCHGDYVNKNIIFTKDLETCIIDFDKCKVDYCAKDLAYFMRRLLKRENTNWNVNLALSIIKNYNEIFKLTPSDLRYLLAYICFPQKYWRISRDYYRNISKCNKTAFLTLLKNTTSKSIAQYNFALELLMNIKNEFNILLI
ncbi:CotS family spore coat protein [Clostridium botulinum]|uniref:Spore coat protein S n=1 Tax=Clostridium botulinum (strain Eklund 17B / Type B) TaxID=935198 RepID=B2TMC4_CLOBB|nr:CotS family spore coat protein [Clostridium sp. ZBS4]ACD21997.1 spore coat protein S [Clostridium botulinum B str. Eklund 17B (NRP)]MBY6976779.1 CotS family spore coat protein [Clostridium botulinum]MBY7002272.1 CotS family spore coat protein [Clostridium botulinum]MCR1274125.1 CotS family spore coat protein [Clostridium botulinum]NFD68804.1 CotS family spore coat protein [Clostridium botulinum]